MSEKTENQETANEAEDNSAAENLEKLAQAAEWEEQEETDAPAGELVEKNDADDIDEGARFISNILTTTICSGANLQPNDRLVGACDAAGQSYARLIDKYAPNGIGWLASPEFAAVIATFNLIAVVKIERKLQHPPEEVQEPAAPVTGLEGGLTREDD